MEEQPPTEPPRRRPEPKSTRGSGRTKAAFTSPPEPDTEPTGEPPRAPRPRTRQTPPAVLFQPPTEPEQQQPTGSARRPPAFPPPGQGSTPPTGQGSTRQNSPESGPEQADQPITPAPDAPETGDSTPAEQDESIPAAQDESTRPSQDTTPAPRKKTAGKKAARPVESTGAAKKTAARKTTAAKKTTTAAKKTTAKKTAAKAAPVRKATTTPAAVEAAPAPPSAAPTPSPGDPTAAAPAEPVVASPRTTQAEPSTGPASPEPASSGSTGTPAAEPTLPDRAAPRVDTEAAEELTGAADGTRVPERVDVVPSGGGVPDRAAVEGTPRPGWQRSTARHVLDHPGYAPELLALAAVRELGPAALAWAARIRTTYPTATADGLALLATRRYVRLSAAGGALSMATGLLAPFAELAVVTWAQASLVLHLAAAHDHDPTAPERAADLLVLTGVHPDGQSARAALDAAEVALRGGPDGSSPRLAEAGWRLGAPIVARSANWLALRLAVRRLPGATTLVTALANSAATERLAARATALYRTTATGPLSAGPSSSGGGGTEGGPSALPYNQSNQLRGSSA
ncbi:hypothetical protein ACFP2T_24130 [Plantactinospora solaniradicis]|uniref:Uncharacterized protein n=1 Tax=Plantactinospora solaniradicis TaxID=1723736 RepID=A0ABW1KG24_9ACTN